jgi:hypothetical protein
VAKEGAVERREFLKTLAGAAALECAKQGTGRAAVAPFASEVPLPPKPKPGLDWIERMELGRHHLVHGLDETGLPYFDVLLRRPYAEAAHDFPDFTDLVGRYWEAALIVQEVTGKRVETEPLLRRRALALFSEPDGLPYNPATTYSYYKPDVVGGSRVLFALVRAAQLEPNEENRRRLRQTVQAIKNWFAREAGANPKREAGLAPLILRPLTEASTVLGEEEPLDFAAQLIKSFRQAGGIREDGRWSGHVHTHLDAIAGIVECGRLKSDTSLVEWGRRAFNHLRPLGTEFGWLPELVDRHDDCVGCETCCIMDYLDSALQLALAGHDDLWDLIERVTRNHLIESQVTDPVWLVEPPDARDDAVTIQRQVGRRMLGAFAGWSSPIGILAYDEPYVLVFWKDQGPGPWDQILGGRIRALQNCCAGSGLKGLWRVWQLTSRIEEKMLVVELPFDRELPEARITAWQPCGEGLTVEVRAPLAVKVRRPGDVKPDRVAARKNGKAVLLARYGDYLTLDRLAPGERLEVTFARPERTERVMIGNPGFKPYAFDVRWRGATAIQVKPSADNAGKGFNYLMKKETVLHMKGDVEHPLYQRAHWRS